MTPNALYTVLGALFRALLNAFAGWLVAKNMLSPEDVSPFVTDATILLATVGATVAWTVWQKWLSEKALEKAINEAPPGTPIEAVKKAARTNRSVADVMTHTD